MDRLFQLKANLQGIWLYSLKRTAMPIKKGNHWMLGHNYEIQGNDRFSFYYITEDQRLLIYFEDLTHPFKRYIYSSKIKEWVKPGGLHVSRENKEEIKKNCKEGWEFLGVPVVFDD